MKKWAITLLVLLAISLSSCHSISDDDISPDDSLNLENSTMETEGEEDPSGETGTGE